jgi:hypothetical protein
VKQERRRSPRYRIDATISVDEGTGRTIDLSSNGVYFESTRPLQPGDHLALVFPFEHSGAGASVRCQARVVRVESRSGQLFGVAATYEPVAFNVSPPPG